MLRVQEKTNYCFYMKAQKQPNSLQNIYLHLIYMKRLFGGKNYNDGKAIKMNKNFTL